MDAAEKSTAPPQGSTLARGNYAYLGLERVAHDHAHQTSAIGRPVRECLADLLRAALGRALRVLFREPRLPRFLTRHESVRAPGRIAVGRPAEQFELRTLGAARNGGAQRHRARLGFGAGADGRS